MNGSTLRKLMAWIKDGDNIYFNRSNVGIGLIAPTAKLHIKGDGSTAATFALKVENSSGSSLLSILNNGKVGINKLTPAYELDIVGDLNFTGNLLKNGAAYNPGSQWQNNGANIYFNSGSVGIGSPSPSTLLEVQGTNSLPFRLHNETVSGEIAQRFRTKAANSAYVHGDIVMVPGATGDTGFIGFRMPFNAATPGLVLNNSGGVGKPKNLPEEVKPKEEEITNKNI